MSPEGYVLDSSALLTFIEDEDGAARVDQLLRAEKVWLPWIVLLEVIYITRKERGEAEADRRYGMIEQMPITVLWAADEPVLLIAARLKAENRLSLADAIIAAFAIYMGATLVHKDPEYDKIGIRLTHEALPYKAQM